LKEAVERASWSAADSLHWDER